MVHEFDTCIQKQAKQMPRSEVRNDFFNMQEHRIFAKFLTPELLPNILPGGLSRIIEDSS